jgi:DNA-binding NarL/FixJ family response regulator
VTGTNVLLINQHEMFTDIMSCVFDAEPDMAVIGRADAASAVDAIVSTNPDVVVLDYDIDNGRGSAVARDIRDQINGIKVVMLIGAPNVTSVRDAISSGCLGVVSKDRGAGDLIGAVRSVARGHSVAAVPQLDAMLETSPEPESGILLTARQSDVLRLMAEGMSTDALAAALFVSRNTIRSHVHQILVKLDAKSKLEAVANGRRAGLLAQ